MLAGDMLSFEFRLLANTPAESRFALISTR